MRISNDIRKSGNNQEDVTKDCDCEGNRNSFVTAPVGIGNVGTKQRRQVDPESVNYVKELSY